MTSVKEVYVELIDEGVPCWRPTQADDLGSGVFRIRRELDPKELNERWQFLPGETVVCEQRALSGGDVLVAVRRASTGQTMGNT